MLNLKRKIKTVLSTPDFFSKKFIKTKLFKALPDKMAIKLLFKANMGYKLNLKNPKTYSEKLQWLKLYYREPLLTTIVDKYSVKDYVASIIGKDFIIPTISVYNTFDEIDFNTLPEKFVLKCNHASGDVVICKDKSTFDIESARQKLAKSLKTDYYKIGREWPYKNVERKIICEEYLDALDEGGVKDYKFFCFDGEPKMMFIASDRRRDCRFDFYDMNFNHLDLYNIHDNADKPNDKPQTFSDMKVIASKLSKGFPHVRVDLYEIKGKIYFGELTLFHGGGLSPFKPKSWDEKMGEWLTLPKKTLKGEK